MSVNYDMSKCLIDFTTCPSNVRLVEHFPQLSAYPEFKNIFDDNEIRIAIAISDIESPFIKIRENELRLQALFEFLDIGLKTIQKKEFFNQVLEYKHPRIFPACSRYIQMINNHDFASWWMLNVAFYDLHKESIKPREKDQELRSYVRAKSDVAQEMDKISTKLKDYEARLFRDTRMKQAVVELELKKIVTFPEMLAEEFNGF